MGKRQISSGRKALYYGGMIVMVLGVLLFLSNFFISPFAEIGFGRDPMGGMAFRGIGGMVLIVVGSMMMKIGARGAAGSGLVLDPDQAREDLKPWAQTAGGLVKDALDEVRPAGEAEPEPMVKVRCPHCRALNDEDAKYCKQCGKAL